MLIFLETFFCFVFEPKCPICQSPVSAMSLCFKCTQQIKMPSLKHESWVYSSYVFSEPAKNLLHSIKYERHFERLRLLRPLLTTPLAFKMSAPTVLIPVPLSPLRFYERGFNQSEWLAKEMGKNLHLKVETKGLIKNKETRAQSTLSRQDRKSNLDQAFQWNATCSTPESVCLVDDVLTTGNTMETCRNCLYEAGVREVFGWTLFKATTSVFHSG